jgi:small Trp-rich protein
MLFLIVGIILVIMKLLHLAPVVLWEWYWIAVPFLLAVCWFEIVEPLMGLDAKRELKRQLELHNKIQETSNKKKPRLKDRGSLR